MADCRKCRFFISKSEMSDDEIAESLMWIYERGRKGSLKGYCSLFNRPVTYYVGKCRGFKQKQRINQVIDKFVKRK